MGLGGSVSGFTEIRVFGDTGVRVLRGTTSDLSENFKSCVGGWNWVDAGVTHEQVHS